MINAILHLLYVKIVLISSNLLTIERVLLRRIFRKLYVNGGAPDLIFIKFAGHEPRLLFETGFTRRRSVMREVIEGSRAS